MFRSCRSLLRTDARASTTTSTPTTTVMNAAGLKSTRASDSGLTTHSKTRDGIMQTFARVPVRECRSCTRYKHSMKLPGRIALTPELPAAILQAHLKNHLHRDYLSVQVRIGRLPRPVLEVLGTSDLDVVTSVSILAKILTKHGVPPDVVANLGNTVLQPIAVFESASKKNAANAVVLLGDESVDGEPLMASIELDRPNASSHANMHWMTSAYPKANELKFKQWKTGGLLIWEA